MTDKPELDYTTTQTFMAGVNSGLNEAGLGTLARFLENADPDADVTSLGGTSFEQVLTAAVEKVVERKFAQLTAPKNDK